MTLTAWLTAIVICGFVWGGFLVLLTKALRSERAKRSDRSEDS